MSESAEAILEPRANPDLKQQSAAEQVLLAAYQSGRLPHAWLLTGPRGIGKATLAFRFARFVLSGGGEGGLFGDQPQDLAVSPDDPVFRQVAAEGHGDLLTVMRRADDKGKIKSVIPVEEARKVTGFLHMTAASGGWRVVVVDPVEEMNASAANALLKALEEPPANALLLLISHAPGRLLPTIRSRCCHLALAPLPEEALIELLAQHSPDLTPTEAGALAVLAEGSIGRALDLAANGGLGLYQELVSVLGDLPALDVPRIHAFAERLGAGSDPSAFRTASELLIWWLARMIRAGSGGPLPPEILAGEEALMQRLLAACALAQWMALWEKISRLFARAEGANLDRKQVVVTAFLEMETLVS